RSIMVRAMPAWFRTTLAEFVKTEPRSIAAELNAAATERSLGPTVESFEAWNGSIRLLQDAAADLATREPGALQWHLLLEFEVPRRSRRVDAVLLADDLIFVLEWKVGSSRFDRA